MKSINDKHEYIDEADLPKCCKKCSKRFYVVLGMSCSCKKLRRLN